MAPDAALCGAMARLIAPGSGPNPGQPYALVVAEGEAAATDIDPAFLVALLRSRGAVLLRGFPPSIEQLQTVTGRLCSGSVFNESPDRALIDPAHNIQSVNGGADAFPLHPELSREPWKPDVCFFHCLIPPDQGGETVICDGVALADALPPAVRAGLERHRLFYIQPAPPWQLAHWFGTETPDEAMLAAPPASCPYRFMRIGDRLARVFSRPALHRTLFGDARAFGNFILFARDYLGRGDFPLLDDGRPVPDDWVAAIRAAAAPLTVPVAWQAGDLLILDNSRFMHGRNPIADPSARLIASNFGYLRDVARDPEGPALQPWRQGIFVPPRPVVSV